MSGTKISERVKCMLWGKAAGRCEYEGCNKLISLDGLTRHKSNIANIAHIYADRSGGPRGNPELSEKSKADPSNLMLLCYDHHHLIDQDIDGHTAEHLREMKLKHEKRIELLAAIQPEMKSEILLYGAKIGDNDSDLTYEKARLALPPERYPASSEAIELGRRNNSSTERNAEFWRDELQQLRRLFDTQVKGRLALGKIPHLSIFAIAPQPLLMELGRLLSDITAAEVFQLHREPQDWIWRDHPVGFSYKVTRPKMKHRVVALNLSLSATILNERILAVLDEPCSIWRMTLPAPDMDFLQSRLQLQQFREKFRWLLNTIKAQHGEDAVIHVFPAVPVAIAVEIGRVWKTKADLPLIVYDQNRECGGFVRALEISHDPELVGV